MFGKRNKKYYGGYATFADRVVYDKDVALFVKKHLRLIDRFDIRKITEASLYAFSILSGSCDAPKGKNWKF
jgi:hypothetical protein